jgi:hypothetical protein
MAKCGSPGDAGATKGTGGATTNALAPLTSLGTVTSPLSTTK